MIEEVVPGNKTRLKIMKGIYENPGINLTELIKKVKASPNLVLKYVNRLSSLSLIKEEKSRGKKKVHIRKLKANFDNEIARAIYSLIEIDKTCIFLKTYKELEPYFVQLRDILKMKEGFTSVSYTHLTLPTKA